MNARILFLVIAMAAGPMTSRATWEPFGPDSITANKICFLLDLENHWGICHDEGIALYDHSSQTWTDYPSYLPVMDACYFNGNEFLVIMGCGTDSDGIYTFDPESGDFDVVTYLECPNFIAYDDIVQKYYVGHHFGLETSADGLNWDPVAGFSNMNIVSMAIDMNHLVLTHMDNLYSVWHSSDHGLTWTQSPPGVPMISDLCFDYEQKLYGIFPDGSWSSGLWSSDDYGYSWEVEFWSVNMKCVGVDALGDVFVGWDENSGGSDEGIAFFDPGSGNYTFLNEGLSSLVINDICINPMMSAIALFCCTDSGAYVSYDYVGLAENLMPKSATHVKVYPNPARDVLHVDLAMENSSEAGVLQILGADGRMIVETRYAGRDSHMILDISGLSAGMYCIVIRNSDRISARALLIQ